MSSSCLSMAPQDAKVSAQAQESQDPAAIPQSTADLTALVQILLQQMVKVLLMSIQSRFQTMSDSIITKIDEMGTRIDDLEKSIGDLIDEVGVEPGDTEAAQGQSDSSHNN